MHVSTTLPETLPRPSTSTKRKSTTKTAETQKRKKIKPAVRKSPSLCGCQKCLKLTGKLSGQGRKTPNKHCPYTRIKIVEFKKPKDNKKVEHNYLEKPTNNPSHEAKIIKPNKKVEPEKGNELEGTKSKKENKIEGEKPEEENKLEKTTKKPFDMKISKENPEKPYVMDDANRSYYCGCEKCNRHSPGLRPLSHFGKGGILKDRAPDPKYCPYLKRETKPEKKKKLD